LIDRFEKGEITVMTRREANTVLGATFATLISGAIAALRGEAATLQHDAQEHATANPTRGVAPLLTESIGDIGDADASMLILTLLPKHVSTPHKHSGPVFAYVLEGRVENQVEPEEPKKYSAGDFWYEPAMHVHRSFTNLSDTEQARVLVFMVTPKGSPAGISVK
jgi:quercetin dioxygenase-like cupin family protein